MAEDREGHAKHSSNHRKRKEPFEFVFRDPQTEENESGGQSQHKVDIGSCSYGVRSKNIQTYRVSKIDLDDAGEDD